MGLRKVNYLHSGEVGLLLVLQVRRVVGVDIDRGAPICVA